MYYFCRKYQCRHIESHDKSRVTHVSDLPTKNIFINMKKWANKFPHYLQLDKMDCGPSCLRMIAKYYGKHYTLQTLRQRCFLTREGVSMLGISDAAETIGFRTQGGSYNIETTCRRSSIALYLTLESESFCCLL